MTLKTRNRTKPEWLRWSRIKHVVYHGSRSATLFDSFDPARSDLGVHLGSLDQALYRIVMKGDPQPIDHGSIFPLWFKVSNLLRLKDTGSFHSDAIADQLARKKIIPKALAKEIIAAGKHDWRSRKIYDPIVRDAIIKAGYDGVVYRNETEGAGDSWIAFHPQQLKSAISNRGTFDPSDPVMTNPQVYHVSKVRFDSLSLDHVGSGTGRSAYAWGLYLTNDKAVADHYKGVLGGPLYSVSIPPSSELLHADRFMSKQPAHVRKVLQDVRLLQRFSAHQADFAAPSGSRTNSGLGFYQFLVYVYGSPRAASDTLRRLGIPGMEFPAEEPVRGRARSARNYVIWDEAAMQITAKNPRRRKIR